MLCGAYMPPDTGSRPRANIPAQMMRERLPKTDLQVEDGPARQSHERQLRQRAGPNKSSGGSITRSNETMNDSDPTELEPESRQNSPTKEIASQTEDEEDAESLNTPEPSPREGHLDHPNEMDVPEEHGMQKLNHVTHDRGASLEKAPMHSHWKHRWQHHHGHPEPSPPPMEEDVVHTAVAHPSSSSRSATAHLPTPEGAHHSRAGKTSSAYKADTKAASEDTEIDTPPPSESGHSPADPANSTSKQQATGKLEKRDAG